jgi:hypothetical protein
MQAPVIKIIYIIQFIQFIQFILESSLSWLPPVQRLEALDFSLLRMFSSLLTLAPGSIRALTCASIRRS